MSARLTCAPHICGGCRLPFVQPVDWTPEGRGWRVLLQCPNCRWEVEELLDQEMVDRLDDELERGFVQLTVALIRMTELNMHEYVDHFAAALAANAILPEDF